MTPDPGTRDLILNAFAQQLATAGYPGVSLAGVAATAGIQKASMYHHFPGGKEQMYAEVALRYSDDLGARVTQAIAAPGGFEGKLIALAAASADQHAGAVSFEQRIYDALDHVSESTRTEVMRRYAASILDPVVALFTRAVDDGDVTGSPGFLMNAFLHLCRAGDGSDGDYARRVVELFLHGAAPSAS